MGTEKSNEIKTKTLSDLLDEVDIEFISKGIENFDSYKNLPLCPDKKGVDACL